MDDHELWAALDRIHALSPRDLYTNPEMERLRRRCVARVEEMTRTEIRLSLSRYIRDTMLSEEALAAGKGWEEVLSFLDWIDGGME